MCYLCILGQFFFSYKTLRQSTYITVFPHSAHAFGGAGFSPVWKAGLVIGAETCFVTAGSWNGISVQDKSIKYINNFQYYVLTENPPKLQTQPMHSHVIHYDCFSGAKLRDSTISWFLNQRLNYKDFLKQITSKDLNGSNMGLIWSYIFNLKNKCEIYLSLHFSVFLRNGIVKEILAAL